MQLCSIEFLLLFLPLFLVAYYSVPRRLQGSVLLFGSILFYILSCADKYWQPILAVELTIVTFCAGLVISGRRRGWLLAVCLVCMAGLLAFFKLYQGGKHLPSGLSFYLFQMAAYLIASFRADIQPEGNLIDYSAKTLMFPKLLSGPLVQPKLIHNGPIRKEYAKSNIHHGLQILILGLAFKILLADRLSGVWSQAKLIGYESISTPYAWLALLAYSMRLYFDFFGYSLMAVGVGHMLGFRLPRNFDNPYAAKSVSEFYRRWHITLGAWFRDNIYIPLGGNRKGFFRTLLNLAVVWLFTGLWHGIGGNYLAWAGLLLFFIINERLWLGRILNRSRVLSHLYTVFVILLSWVPFAIGGFDQMVLFFGRLFGAMGQVLNSRDYLLLLDKYWPALLAGVILATPGPERIWQKIRNSRLADVLLFVLFWIVLYCIGTAEQSTFMYFSY